MTQPKVKHYVTIFCVYVGSVAFVNSFGTDSITLML